MSSPHHDVQIYNAIEQYEDTLTKLIDTVDHYQPNVALAKDLIQMDNKLRTSLQQFHQYDQISKDWLQLDQESQDLNHRTQLVLESLNECHQLLNELPTVPQIEFEMDTILSQFDKVNTQNLLQYANKLSKFTKRPASFDKGTIGPNNFIWPAEDALRKGMLAIASLNKDKLIHIDSETGTDKVTVAAAADITESTEKQTEPLPVQEQETAKEEPTAFLYGQDKTTDNTEKDKDKEKDLNKDDMDLDLDLDLDLFNDDL